MPFFFGILISKRIIDIGIIGNSLASTKALLTISFTLSTASWPLEHITQN